MKKITLNSNPCLTCGVCCTHFRVSFYFGEVDSQPGGFVPQHRVIPISPFRVAMKGTELGFGRCNALTGQIGLNIGCEIYDIRPNVCREFPVFIDNKINPECNRLRLKNNMEELVVLS